MRIIKNDIIIEDVTVEDALAILGKVKFKKKYARKGAKDDYDLPSGVPIPINAKLREKGGPVIPYTDAEIIYVYKRLNEQPKPRVKDVYDQGIKTGSLHPSRKLSTVHNIRGFVKNKDRSKMSEKTWDLIHELEAKKEDKTESFIGDIIK